MPGHKLFRQTLLHGFSIHENHKTTMQLDHLLPSTHHACARTPAINCLWFLIKHSSTPEYEHTDPSDIKPMHQAQFLHIRSAPLHPQKLNPLLTITIEDLGTRLVEWHCGRHGSRWIRLTFVRQGTMEVHAWMYLWNQSSLQLYACCWQMRSWACPQGTASRSSFRCFHFAHLI